VLNVSGLAEVSFYDPAREIQCIMIVVNSRTHEYYASEGEKIEKMYLY
jgi:hypothetical protein